MRSTVQTCFAANNILLMRNWNHVLERKWLIASLSCQEVIKTWKKLRDRMIKQLLDSVTAKYRDLSVSRRSIICLSLRLRQIIDQLATDKLRYFAQPRPMIVNYYTLNSLNSFLIGRKRPRKRTVNFRNLRPWRHNCRLYKILRLDYSGYHKKPHPIIAYNKALVLKGVLLQSSSFSGLKIK